MGSRPVKIVDSGSDARQATSTAAHMAVHYPVVGNERIFSLADRLSVDT